MRQLREVVNDVHARIEAEEKIQREQDEKLAALAAEAQREREAAETKGRRLPKFWRQKRLNPA
ncbi:MAG: hypothetical protein IPH31_17120 [Lewinellaceae bacterium]|nr:hypothetical protein [Lewinellaceae bacterium]